MLIKFSFIFISSLSLSLSRCPLSLSKKKNKRRRGDDLEERAQAQLGDAQLEISLLGRRRGVAPWSKGVMIFLFILAPRALRAEREKGCWKGFFFTALSLPLLLV